MITISKEELQDLVDQRRTVLALRDMATQAHAEAENFGQSMCPFDDTDLDEYGLLVSTAAQISNAWHAVADTYDKHLAATADYLLDDRRSVHHALQVKSLLSLKVDAIIFDPEHADTCDKTGDGMVILEKDAGAIDLEPDTEESGNTQPTRTRDTWREGQEIHIISLGNGRHGPDKIPAPDASELHRLRWKCALAASLGMTGLSVSETKRTDETGTVSRFHLTWQGMHMYTGISATTYLYITALTDGYIARQYTTPTERTRK